jgi:DNA mismatch repair protein MutS
MNECAFILNTATEKSLVIMDEVGRGTGTNDGLSIAWAVSEELLNRARCRTIFATHFHELSLLSHPRLANRSMEVLDKDGKIVFLRKLKEGPSSESYGIHVAKLAGLSQTVLARAGQIMELLKERDADIGETFHHAGAVGASLLGSKAKPCFKDALMEAEKPDAFEFLMREINPEQMTPVEALNLLSKWKKLVSTGVNFPLNQKQPKQHGKKNGNAPSLFE